MVAELEEPRPVAAVVRPPPGGEGQAGSARGEGVDAHVLAAGSGEQQLVVGDRGAVLQRRIVDNRTAGRVADPRSKHRGGVEAIVELQAGRRSAGEAGGEGLRR